MVPKRSPKPRPAKSAPPKAPPAKPVKPVKPATLAPVDPDLDAELAWVRDEERLQRDLGGAS